MKKHFFYILFTMLILSSQLFGQKVGVYKYALKEVPLDYPSIISILDSTANRFGFEVLAITQMGSPEECEFKSTVISIVDPSFVNQLVKVNPTTAPYACVDKINVFQDENGTHVSFVNPNSILRTVLMNDKDYKPLAQEHTTKLVSWIREVLSGTATEDEYGQFRKKGYISRTMGVMAGGPFIEKIQTIFEFSDKSLQEVSQLVQASFSVKGADYGIHEVFHYPVPGTNSVLFGVSGTPLDSKSFEIVRAGSDKSRKDFKCPGIAHASAYPLEVVMVEKDGKVMIQMVDAMFRMKIYFEDAGKWAFMKNMGMPGAIADEIKSLIEAKLK
ncbi:MAG: hypothetical protein Kow00108_13970 [Calditrichia bacterium]